VRLKRAIWRLQDWENGQRQHTDGAATEGSESGLTLAVFPIVAVSSTTRLCSYVRQNVGEPEWTTFQK